MPFSSRRSSSTWLWCDPEAGEFFLGRLTGDEGAGVLPAEPLPAPLFGHPVLGVVRLRPMMASLPVALEGSVTHGLYLYAPRA